MAAKKKDTEPKDLASVLSGLRKAGSEIGAFEGFNMTTKGLTTGNLTLDYLTGVGGIPVGRITELLGPPSSGKTTTGLQTAAHVQQAGGRVVYLDYERALDPDYCQALGLDVRDESFLYMKPDYFEEGANAFRSLCATGEIDLVVHDSVAAMTTKHELEADTGAVQVADRAKMAHQYMRQLSPLLSHTGTACIFINHLLDLVDTTPMGQRMAAQGIKRTTSPGGKAIPFYASLRIEFKQIGNISTNRIDALSNEEMAVTIQTKVQATVVKNKVADPFRTAELRTRFGSGFSNEFSVLSVLTAYGVIKKAGAWYTFADPAFRLDDDHLKVQSEETVLELMQNNPGWFAILNTEARRILNTGAEVIAHADPADYDENGNFA